MSKLEVLDEILEMLIKEAVNVIDKEDQVKK